MNAVDAARLLTVCAAYDNRKPDEDQAKAWALALAGLDFHPCRDAIVQHYQTSTDRIMPAHVRRLVRRDRVDRIDDDVIPMPVGLDPDDTAAYIAVLRAGRKALADGRDLPQPEGLTRRSLRELGGPVRRVNELHSEAIAPRLTLARQAAEAARIQAQATTGPEPEPLVRPEDRLREPDPHNEETIDA